MLLKKTNQAAFWKHANTSSNVHVLWHPQHLIRPLNRIWLRWSKYLEVISAGFFWRPAPQQQKKAVNTIKDKTHYAISNVGFTLKPHMQFLHSAYSNISIELHSAKPCNLSALRKKLRNQTAQEQIAWFYIPWCLNHYEITTISKTRLCLRRRCNVRPCRRDLQAT